MTLNKIIEKMEDLQAMEDQRSKTIRAAALELQDLIMDNPDINMTDKAVMSGWVTRVLDANRR